MTELATLIFLVFAALVIVRTGALALVKTGLSRDSAAFQAQSAFMGVGFTTAESEATVTHPVRRQIIRTLMWGGYSSITATVGTAVVTFAKPDANNGVRLLLLLGAIVVLVATWRLRPFERLLDRIISSALERFTSLDVHDYEELMQLRRGFSVAHLPVDQGGWIDGHTLRSLRLADEGVVVLAIERASGAYLGTPTADTLLKAGDRLLCYGRHELLERLSDREVDFEGERQRRLAVEQERLLRSEQAAEDRAHEPSS